MVDESSISGKYTRYGKKIGLDLSGKDHHVVLNFPYKDCVLEGGMTKEEKARSERFLNNALELDGKYIKDALFSPKILTNFDYIGTRDNRQPTTDNRQPTTNL